MILNEKNFSNQLLHWTNIHHRWKIRLYEWYVCSYLKNTFTCKLIRVGYPQSCTQWALSSRLFTTRSTSYKYLGACTSLHYKLATVCSTPSFSILQSLISTDDRKWDGEWWRDTNLGERKIRERDTAWKWWKKITIFLKLIVIHTCIKLVPC